MELYDRTTWQVAQTMELHACVVDWMPYISENVSVEILNNMSEFTWIICYA